jgi:hypothetical protein
MPFDRGRRAFSDRLPRRRDHHFLDVREVGGEQLAPLPLRLRLAERWCGMGMRHAGEQPLFWKPERRHHAPAKRPLVGEVGPPAQVGVEEHERLAGRRLADREGREEERPVDALRRVVYRRAPVAAEDAHWRRDVGPGQAYQAREGGVRCDRRRSHDRQQ